MKKNPSHVAFIFFPKKKRKKKKHILKGAINPEKSIIHDERLGNLKNAAPYNGKKIFMRKRTNRKREERKQARIDIKMAP